MTIDTASVSIGGTAPAIAPGGQFWYGSAPPAGTPFAVDANGMLLDIQLSGIGFEDTTFFQSYGTNTGPTAFGRDAEQIQRPAHQRHRGEPLRILRAHARMCGLRARGTASLNGTNTLTISSPPSSISGPVLVRGDGATYTYENGLTIP
jgi:hypothetical protein